jgi:hypothetical protein
MRKLIVWILKIIVAGFLNFGILCVIGKYSSRLLAYGNYVLLVCFVPTLSRFFFSKTTIFPKLLAAHVSYGTACKISVLKP